MVLSLKVFWFSQDPGPIGEAKMLYFLIKMKKKNQSVNHEGLG